MLTLAIDTATKICTVALLQDQKILGEYSINAGMTHSEGLLPQIEQLLQRAGRQKNELELLAVSMGPGSFTGLRIGLATAEAVAYSRQCFLHGVNTLKALAWNLPVDGLLLSPVLDAQKGNYYQSLYRWDKGVLSEIMPVRVVSGAVLYEELACRGERVALLGECDRLEQNRLPLNVFAAPHTLRMPHASSVGLAALDEFSVAEDRKILGLEPYYIRRSEAEELWEKKQN